MSIVRAVRVLTGYVNIPEAAKREIEAILTELESPLPASAGEPPAAPAPVAITAPAEASPSEPSPEVPASEEGEAEPPAADSADAPVNPQILSE